MKERFSQNYIEEIKSLFEKTKVTLKSKKILSLEEGLEKAGKIILEAKKKGKKLIFIGNGGSAAISLHKALDFNFLGKVKSISFSDPALFTCLANDFGFENIFAKQIEILGEKNDILIAISSSGTSQNIILGAKMAQKKKCEIITLSGFDKENTLSQIGDLNFWVDSRNFNQVEAVHLLLLDCILDLLVEKEKEKKEILVVLDRDGTLICDDGYFGKEENWREKVKFYEGAIDLIRDLNKFSKVIVCTNQIGVARGLYGPERVKEIHNYLDRILREKEAKIDGWYFSPYVEKSWAKKEGLNLNSPWVLKKFPETRKPNIGMIKMALEDFRKDLSFFKKIFVVGDSLDDLKMALKVGGIGIFFQNEKNHSLLNEVKKLQKENPGKIFIVKNLFSAKKIIQNA